MNLESVRKCGHCNSDIPITNIAVRETKSIIFGKRWEITHWWCDNCGSITVVKPVVLKPEYIDMLQYHWKERLERMDSGL